MLDLVTMITDLAHVSPTSEAVRRARHRVDQLVRHHALDGHAMSWPQWLHAHDGCGRLVASMPLEGPSDAVVAIAKLRTVHQRLGLVLEPGGAARTDVRMDRFAASS